MLNANLNKPLRDMFADASLVTVAMVMNVEQSGVQTAESMPTVTLTVLGMYMSANVMLDILVSLTDYLKLSLLFSLTLSFDTFSHYSLTFLFLPYSSISHLLFLLLSLSLSLFISLSFSLLLSLSYSLLLFSSLMLYLCGSLFLFIAFFFFFLVFLLFVGEQVGREEETLTHPDAPFILSCTLSQSLLHSITHSLCHIFFSFICNYNLVDQFLPSEFPPNFKHHLSLTIKIVLMLPTIATIH